VSGLGRPSSYTPELGTQICLKLAGGESLRSICELEEMPALSTVLLWVVDGKHKEFSEQYEIARMAQAEMYADELREIADDGHNDWMLKKYGDTEAWIENGEAMGRSRLRLDARKWIASKLLSKRYGDKIEQTHKGDASAPLVVISPAEAKF